MSINPYDPPSNLNSQNSPIQDPNGFDTGVLRFSLGVDDFLAFQQFHVRNSPSQRNLLYFSAIVGLIVAIYLTSDVFARIPIWLSFILLILNLFFAIFVAKIVFHRLIRFYLRRMLSEGSQEGLLGLHELEIANGFLIERTAVNEHRHLLSKIDRIVESDEYVFVYISSLQAHVIPKRRIEHGDLYAFSQRLRDGQSHVSNRLPN